MRKLLCVLITIMPCICFGSSTKNFNQCTTSQVLAQIRPGATWTMQGNSIEKLNWLDTKSKKPTVAEVERARQDCIEEAKTRDALKAQARLDVKSPVVSTDKKVQALILLLDMDK